MRDVVHDHPSGTFITFEGIDGAGKTKQSQLLDEALRRLGYRVFGTYEPGWEGFGSDIRKLFYGYDKLLTDEARLCLIHAQRHIHLTRFIRPALAEGKVVVCDRFRDSTEAFQIAVNDRNDLVPLFGMMEDVIVGQTMPDLTVVLDVPIEVARHRMELRGDRTVFDRKPSAHHERVRRCYQTIVPRDAVRCRLVDGDRPIEDVHADVLRHALMVLKGPVYVREDTVC